MPSSSAVATPAVFPDGSHAWSGILGVYEREVDWFPSPADDSSPDLFPGEILSAAVVSDDLVVFVATVPTPASIGHRLHMLQPSGEMTSRGYDGGVFSSDAIQWPTGVAVAGRADAVWAVPHEVNRLVRWDLAPEPRMGRIFERRVVEFDEGGDAFMPATMGSAMLDDHGLWLTWHTADHILEQLLSRR